jgi:threonine synthase
MKEQNSTTVRAVACASTGDTSASLAAYAAAAGIPAIVFLPRDKITSAQLIQPIANGAHVLALETDFDGCMEIVRKVTQDNSIYLANSINSLRIEGQKSVGIEIVRQFNWEAPDWIIVPAGNLGNISALYKGLQLLKVLGIISRLPRLVAAQASNANPFYMSYQNGFDEKISISAKTTIASAIQIGDPVSYQKAVKAIQNTDGIVEEANEHDLANVGALADLTGLYTCPHTAVALAVLTKLIRNGSINSDQRVVVISTAHGLKFTGAKMGYHNETLEDVRSFHANTPMNLPADAIVVSDAIERKLNDY